MPAGRPSKYTPQVIDEINKYLEEAIPENMAIPTVEGVALRLGISRETVYDWARTRYPDDYKEVKLRGKRKHPEFSDTIRRMKMLQKEALVRTGIFGGKEINQSIVALLLKVNHKMIEMTKTDITSDGKQLEGLKVIMQGDGDKA